MAVNGLKSLRQWREFPVSNSTSDFIFVKPGEHLIIRMPPGTTQTEAENTKLQLESRHKIIVSVIISDSIEVFAIPQPVTYGLWFVNTGGWAKNVDGSLVTFTDLAVAEAYCAFTTCNDSLLIRQFLPGGFPLPIEELDKLGFSSRQAAAAYLMRQQ